MTGSPSWVSSPLSHIPGLLSASVRANARLPFQIPNPSVAALYEDALVCYAAGRLHLDV